MEERDALGDATLILFRPDTTNQTKHDPLKAFLQWILDIQCCCAKALIALVQAILNAASVRSMLAGVRSDIRAMPCPRDMRSILTSPVAMKGTVVSVAL